MCCCQMSIDEFNNIPRNDESHIKLKVTSSNDLTSRRVEHRDVAHLSPPYQALEILRK
jgi:hypothetical protein